jgi:hypothetical protein
MFLCSSSVGYFQTWDHLGSYKAHHSSEVVAHLLHLHLRASDREKIVSVTVLLVLLGSLSSPLDLTGSRELLLFRDAERFDG